MTSEMKCPFCGKQMINDRNVYFGCSDQQCWQTYGWARNNLWHALIQAKQDLEIAKKALTDAKQTLFYCWEVDDNHAAKCTAEDVEKALEQINHKE